MKLTFNDPSLFIGLNGMLMDAESQVIERTLPSQINPSGFMSAASEFVKQSTTAIVAGNFALNILL